MDSKRIAFIALALSIGACIAGAVSLLGDRPPTASEISNEVYLRFLRELEAELVPVYRDYGLKPTSQASTLKEVLRPLLPINMPTDKGLR